MHFYTFSKLRDSSTNGKNKKQLSGSGRPVTFKNLDENLAVWIRERRAQKLRVSRRIIQQQAERMFNTETDEEGFKGC
jgi:hypothetical protein